eukprot:UN26551
MNRGDIGWAYREIAADVGVIEEVGLDGECHIFSKGHDEDAGVRRHRLASSISCAVSCNRVQNFVIQRDRAHAICEKARWVRRQHNTSSSSSITSTCC